MEIEETEAGLEVVLNSVLVVRLFVGVP